MIDLGYHIDVLVLKLKISVLLVYGLMQKALDVLAKINVVSFSIF